jgi:hypothetical protein
VLGKRAAFGKTGRDQVVGAAVQRHREFTGREPRAVDDRLIIAGKEAGGIAELADSHRNEIGLEELPRRLRSERSRLDRACADLFE